MGLRTAIGVAIASVLLGAATGCGAEPANRTVAVLAYDAGPENGTQYAGIFVVDAEGGHRVRLTGTPPPEAGAAQWSPEGDRILMETVDTGEIWTIKPDGTEARKLADGIDASWSPDGREIAIVRERGEVEILAADGAPRRTIHLAIEQDQFTEIAPDWSPDGRRLAVEVESGSGNQGLVFVVAADGKGNPQLVSKPEPGVVDESPDWSPDGSTIAFIRWTQDGPFEAWIMKADGSGARKVVGGCDALAWFHDGTSLLCQEKNEVVRHPLGGGPPTRIGPAQSGLLESRGRFTHRLNRWVSWAPDGKRVAYVSSGKVIVSAPDGSARNVLTEPVVEAAPEWSPDGSKLAFVRITEQETVGEVAVMGADGKGQRVISRGDGPQWSPDGTELLISRGAKHGVAEIALATLEPIRVRALTTGRSPAWSPDGASFAFVRDRYVQTGEPNNEEGLVAVASTLLIARRDGTGERVLARSSASDERPSTFDAPVWLPDGRSLLVEEHDPMAGGHARVRRVGLDGSEETIATDRQGVIESLSVSADGKWAAFVRDYVGSRIEKLLLETGKREIIVSSDDGFVGGVAWSPDSKELAYIAFNADEDFELFVVDPDGSHQRRISKPQEPVGWFDWRPAPSG